MNKLSVLPPIKEANGSGKNKKQNEKDKEKNDEE
jgi:hypothetical protein